MPSLFVYSGLIATLTAIIFVVLPSLFAGIKYSKQPISYTVRKRPVGIFFKFGLIVTGLLLIPNTLNLVFRFQSEETLLGAALYIVGAICVTLTGLVDIDSNKNVHAFVTKGYFIFTMAGSFLFSYAIWPGFPIPLLIVLFGAIWTSLFYFKFGLKAYSEYTGILFSILWVMYFYFI